MLSYRSQRLVNLDNILIEGVLLLIIIFIFSIIFPNICANDITDNLTKLTQGDTDYSYPRFAPDGERIVYISSGNGNNFTQIWIMNLLDNNRIQLTSEACNHSWPSFSPNGDKIIYTRENEDNSEIWIMDRDGTNQSLVLGNDFYNYSCPNISPDEKKIAYVNSTNIWISNIDSSNQKPLTTKFSIDMHPIFSPDGRRIAYSSWGEDFPTGYCPSYHINVMNDDGSNDLSLTHPAIGNQFFPSYHPNEKKIIYTNNSDLWIMDDDGENKILLLNLEGEIEYPSFSPDGKKIIYVMDGDIWIMDCDITDTDKDGIFNFLDPDIDGDGISNEEDYYPNNPKKWKEDESDLFQILIALTFIVTIIIVLTIIIKITIKKHRNNIKQKGAKKSK